ncbi:MAG: hypothetical protein SFV51_23570 [Bryobacteraceae bacterium]|nr:hypothetical protein [Bryobacteraceae bacterium]
MSVNREQPHVLVLPEDDANRKIANGFPLHPNLSTRRLQVLEEAGGWMKTLEKFERVHAGEMDRYPNRFMVLLIDFDRDANRRESARRWIPGRLADRVFVLGSLTDPEALKRDLGSYEPIGRALADDCHVGTDTTWSPLP